MVQVSGRHETKAEPILAISALARRVYLGQVARPYFFAVAAEKRATFWVHTTWAVEDEQCHHTASKGTLSKETAQSPLYNEAMPFPWEIIEAAVSLPEISGMPREQLKIAGARFTPVACPTKHRSAHSGTPRPSRKIPSCHAERWRRVSRCWPVSRRRRSRWCR